MPEIRKIQMTSQIEIAAANPFLSLWFGAVGHSRLATAGHPIWIGSRRKCVFPSEDRFAS
jgi:hypothetical protein